MKNIFDDYDTQFQIDDFSMTEIYECLDKEENNNNR